jgi:ferritin-like metal-binding protein YciE
MNRAVIEARAPDGRRPAHEPDPDHDTKEQPTMAEMNTANSKLVQYLIEAYSKERELERSLQAHIAMTDRKPYKKRLQEHLRETKRHAKQVEQRARKLGAGGLIGDAVKEGTALVKQAAALGKGQLHAARGSGLEEKMLKNAKTEYSEEHEEIATYAAIETLAQEIGDKETAKVARQIRREEERMASFLERQIPVLTRAVAKAEIPAAERNGSGGGSSRKRRSASSRKGSGSSGRSRSSASSRRKPSSSGRRKSSSTSRRKSSSTSRRKSGSRS